MQASFPVRFSADGRALLNLGSSARIAAGWNNIDQSLLLRLAQWPKLASALHAVGIVSDYRFDKLRRLDPQVVCWDLRRGIPFPDRTFDVVYHSHVLEHIDRDDAPGFLRECRRVLKTDGTLRVVVPDLEQLARRYLGIVERLSEESASVQHAAVVNEIFDQMVPRIPRTRADNPPLVRFLEAMFIGDTARSGTMHRWMYDRFSLARLLMDSGFVDVETRSADTSRIEGWATFHLDTEVDGSQYKPESVYVEARRPAQ